MSRINLLVWAIMLWTGAAVVVVACGGGGGQSFSGAGSDAVPLKPNMTQAIANVNARGAGWLLGVTSIRAADRDPPPGVSSATVTCPGDIVLYNTTFDHSVAALERLLVHEAYEIQHGCVDNDPVANAFSRCYAGGGTYEQCLEEA